MNALESLSRFTVVVADTGDLDAIARFKPQDATTNPSLLLKVAQQKQFQFLVDDALKYAHGRPGEVGQRALAFADKLAVNFGREILKTVPGRVSTEVAASFSFDTDGTIAKAHELLDLYTAVGVTRERVLIKVGSTWEGIRAAEALEKEGIHCNMTLLFSFAQAVACADARVTLISPFVGRIYDYYVKEGGGAAIPPDKDPGVASVQRIYDHYKKFDYRTQIMGASFRRVEQVLGLAGCDLLTISPDLLKELTDSPAEVVRRLSPEAAKASDATLVHLDEKAFRFMHNEDPMAVNKLSDGIRRFHADGLALQAWATRLGL
jgi:transaldolase